MVNPEVDFRAAVQINFNFNILSEVVVTRDFVPLFRISFADLDTFSRMHSQLTDKNSGVSNTPFSQGSKLKGTPRSLQSPH
jgi:hypothetical protein